MNLQTTTFGRLPNGREAKLFEMINNSGISIKITNYGGIIASIEMPDKKGIIENVVCGFSHLDDYLNEEYLASYPYFGAVLGRFAGRISKGHLEIGGKSYALNINSGQNHLHGGNSGFDKQIWEADIFQKDDASGVKLSYHSRHLEENYPGNLDVTCIYTLTNYNELAIEYSAVTDSTTVVNLSNHTYFNLTAGRENILNHELKLVADKITEMSNHIPTGSIVPIIDSPLDFCEFKNFARDLKKLPTGYDENFVLNNEAGKLIHAGTLREKISGRNVEVFTTQPLVQVYTGYWIPELVIGGKKKFGRYSGVALVTQHYPDSIHHPNFPTTLLHPGETYSEKTVYRFSINSL